MEIRSVDDYKKWLSENRELLNQKAIKIENIPQDWLDDWEYKENLND